jgi:hypothetical protein
MKYTIFFSLLFFTISLSGIAAQTDAEENNDIIKQVQALTQSMNKKLFKSGDYLPHGEHEARSFEEFDNIMLSKNVPQIRAYTLTLLLRYIKKIVKEERLLNNSLLNFKDIFEDLDLYEDYAKFEGVIIGTLCAQILKHGECREHADALLLDLLGLGIKTIEIRSCSLKQNMQVNHGYLFFKHKNVSYVADSYFNLVLPEEDFYKHPLILDYFDLSSVAEINQRLIFGIPEIFTAPSLSAEVFRFYIDHLEGVLRQNSFIEEVVKIAAVVKNPLSEKNQLFSAFQFVIDELQERK